MKQNLAFGEDTVKSYPTGENRIESYPARCDGTELIILTGSTIQHECICRIDSTAATVTATTRH
tara:strand:- start:3436 stop:3627 length:192 start_codon:yes stop_codon:yes gene_type:complete